MHENLRPPQFKVTLFDTRRTPREAPAVPVSEAPRSCVRINNMWVSHIIGALERLTQDDAWTGDDNQKLDAIDQVEQVIGALASGDDCEQEGGGETVNLQFRFTGCDLEYTTDGILWNAVPGWSTGAAACFAGEDGEPGPPGPAGADGAPGEPGPMGPPGSGTVIIYPPPVAPGTSARCSLATYYAEIFLPEVLSTLIDERRAGTSQGDLVRGILSVVASVGGMLLGGGIGFLGATGARYLFGGLGAAAAGLGLGSTLWNADPNAIEAAAGPQFWEDVREAMYISTPSNGVLDTSSRVQAALRINEIDNIAAPVLADALMAIDEEWINRAGFMSYGRAGDCSVWQDLEAVFWNNTSPPPPEIWTDPVAAVEGVRSNVTPEVPLVYRTFAGNTGWSVNDVWSMTRRTVVGTVRIWLTRRMTIGQIRWRASRSSGTVYGQSFISRVFDGQTQVHSFTTGNATVNPMITHQYNHVGDYIELQHTADQMYSLSSYNFIELALRELG